MAMKRTGKRIHKRDTGAEATLGSLCRGLVGYVSYLATCRSSTLYNELLLYPPIFQIGQAQGYRVRCEYPVDTAEIGYGDRDRDTPHPGGDGKKIDFDFLPVDSTRSRFGLEVKWSRKAKTLDVGNDVRKLLAYEKEGKGLGYLLVFGKISVIEHLKLERMLGLNSQRHVIKWDRSKTRYAARWYQVF